MVFETQSPVQLRRRRLRERGETTILAASDALDYGIDLSQQGLPDWEDWLVKIAPGQEDQDDLVSFITPDKYEVLQDQTVITPEGRRTTWDELIREDQEQVAATALALFPEGMPEAPRPDEDMAGPMPQLEATRAGLGAWIEQNPEAFMERLQQAGRTPETESILKMVAPDITEEDMAQVFNPYAVNVPAEGLRFDLSNLGARAEILDLRGPAVLQPNGEIRLETGEFVGLYNQQTGQIEQPAPTPEEVNANLVAFEEQRDTDPAFKRVWAAPADIVQEFNHADLANPFTAGVGDLVSSVGGAAKWMGLDGVGANLSEAGRFLQMQDPASFWQGPYTPGFYVNRTLRALPFAIAILPAAILGGYAAAAGGAAIGLGALGQTILGAAGGAALARPIEGALEAGNTYDEAIRSGMSEEQASKAADSVFRKNVTLAGGDFLQFAIAFAPIKGSGIFASRLFKIGRVAGMPVIEGLSEAGEEIVQDIFQRQALGQEIRWDPEMQVAAIVGGLMGVGLGAGGEVFTYMKMRIADQLPAGLKQQFDAIMQEQQDAGLTLDEAELMALDEIAATPEGQAVIENVVQQMQREEAFNQVEPKTAEEQAAWERIADAVLPAREAQQALPKEVAIPKAEGFADPEGQNATASVPLMITKRMRAQLELLDVTPAEIDRLTPQQAWDMLSQVRTSAAPAAAAPPPAPDAPIAEPPPEEPPPVEPFEEPMSPDVDSAIRRLVEMVKSAKPVRAATEVLKSAELRKRVAQAEQSLMSGEGREAFRRSTGALKGQLPKAQFEPPESGLGAEQVTILFNYIRDSGELYFTKLNTSEALQSVLMGEIPTRGDILLLEKMFGPELAAAILSKRSLGAKAWEAFVDVWNLPKAMLASWDFSAPLRQGGVLFAGQYGQSVPALKQMVLAAIKESNARAITERLESSPHAELRRHSGLYIAPLFGEATRLSDREESFMTRWAHKIPGIKWSERAYIIYLNVLRADVFDFYASKFEEMGVEATEFDYQEIASFINHATGRGDLGKLADSATLLNSMFFSPRLQASRVQVPLSLASKSKLARQIAAKNITAFSSMVIVMLGLLALAGATVELDPRSTDFGKARIGNTRLDFAAGFLQYIRLVAQLTTGLRKTGTGKLVEINRLDTAIRFLRSKFSPSLGLFVDVLDGQTFVGEELDLQPATIKKQVYQRFVPLFAQDMADAIADAGLLGGFLAAPAGLGVGAVTYKDAIERNTLKLGEVDEEGEVYRSNDLWSYISSVTSGQAPEEIAGNKNLPPHVLSVVQARQDDQMLDKMKDTKDRSAALQRNDWLRQNPTENAVLAVWGQRKPLTQQAYDEALRLMEELAIPEGARPKGFPPPEISTAFLAYNDAADNYATSSAEAKLARMENPAFDAWGMERYGWTALDDDIRVVRLSVQYRAQDDHYYDVLDNTEDRQKYLEENPEYRDDRRRRDAYRLDAPDDIVENFVEYYQLPASTRRDGYRRSHPEFDQWGQQNLGWKPLSRRVSSGFG